jgi:serine/alanine adding enzyme
MYDIIQASRSNNTEWQDYLNKKGVIHYAYDWRWSEIIKNVFGHTPYFLILKENKEIRGALPLVFIKSILFGKALISIPYMNGGGALADSEEYELALCDHAVKLAYDLKVKYLELRMRREIDPKILSKHKLSLKSHKVAMILDLKDDPEELFSSFPPKLRSQIRKPTKDGYVAESYKGQDIQDSHIKDFYNVFADTMRNLGTPVYPIKLFRETIRSFGDRSRLTLVRSGDTPVAGGITIRTGAHVEIPWASALRKHSKSAPNMLLYWETIRQCTLDGCKTFDFGRSSLDSGTYKFKAQWGAKPLPLYWYYHTDGSPIPEVNPNNKKFELAIKAWRLIPLPITKILGSFLTKSIP